MPRSRVLACLLCWGSLALPAAGGDLGFGPLRVPSQSPGQGLRMTVVPISPEPPAPGTWVVRSRVEWVNVWSWEPGTYLFDFEMLEGALSAGHGLDRRTWIELEVQDRSTFRGSMDGLIQNFHHLFGLPQGGRDRFPRYAYGIHLEDGRGRVLVDRDRPFGDATGAQVSLFRVLVEGDGHRPWLTLGGGLRWALSRGMVRGPHRWDAQVRAAAGRRWHRWSVFLNAGYTWFGETSFAGVVPFKHSQWTGALSVEWRAFRRSSIVGQYLAAEGPVDGIEPFDSFSHEVLLAWVGPVGPGLVLEAGFIENMFHYDAGPDFGIHLGLRVTLPRRRPRSRPSRPGPGLPPAARGFRGAPRGRGTPTPG